MLWGLKDISVQVAWACLKVWEEVQGWRNDAERGVMDETRHVFQNCGFNHHRFCTGNCDEKGLQILLLWFPEITSSPRRTFTLPLLFPMDYRD